MTGTIGLLLNFLLIMLGTNILVLVLLVKIIIVNVVVVTSVQWWLFDCLFHFISGW